MNEPLPNNEQERALYAFKNIEALKEGIGTKYRSVVKNAPEKIHQCGLLQTLAFSLSKAKKYQEHKIFLQHILNHLLEPNSSGQEIEKLYEQLLKKSSFEIIRMTQDTQKLLVWLGRFAAKFQDEKPKS